MERGFSTLEIVMAMAVIVMVLSAVVMTSFTNQGTLIGSQTYSEAMNRAQELLEQEQALARKDFDLVNATTSSDGFYTGSVTVTNPIDPGTGKMNYDQKSITATVSWKDQRGVTRSAELSALIADFSSGSGGSTCNSSLEGNWLTPVAHAYTIVSLAGVSGSYPVSGIDAYRDRLYAAAGTTVGGSDRTFYIFNLDHGVPSYVSGSGIDTSGASTKGIAALQVVATSSAPGAKVYAYAANAVTPDWSSSASCGTASASCSQLQVIDVTNPSAPAIVKNFKFATSTFSVPVTPSFVTGSGGQGAGQSIFYKNGYIFLGLTKTGSGPEFNIFDVHDPLNPQEIGSYSIGRTVYSITVSGNFAYLATDDNANDTLTILNISDPVHPQLVWPGTVPSGIGYGRGVARVGDTVHVVKTADSAKPEWYILNDSRPSSAAPTVTASADYGSSVSLANILIRDYLAFMTTTSPSGQLLIRSATSTAQYAPPIALPGAGSALDCEGNYVYAGSADGAGTITVVTGS